VQPTYNKNSTVPCNRLHVILEYSCKSVVVIISRVTAGRFAMKGTQGPTLSHITSLYGTFLQQFIFLYAFFLRTQGFIMFKRTRYLTISWATIQLLAWQLTHYRLILMFSIHLCLDRPSEYFPWSNQRKFYTSFLFFPLPPICFIALRLGEYIFTVSLILVIA